MRTTVNLPDDVYRMARSLAAAKQISLGDAIAELARKGLNRESIVLAEGVFPCFEISRGAPPITLEQTLAAEDEP